jgi:hypothetical protein
MKSKYSLKPIVEIPYKLNQAFKPLYRIEAITGLAGYGIITNGAINGDKNQIILGLITSAVSGAYGAYKDGAFSKKNNDLNNNQQSELEKIINKNN